MSIYIIGDFDFIMPNAGRNGYVCTYMHHTQTRTETDCYGLDYIASRISQALAREHRADDNATTQRIWILYIE